MLLIPTTMIELETVGTPDSYRLYGIGCSDIGGLNDARIAARDLVIISNAFHFKHSSPNPEPMLVPRHLLPGDRIVNSADDDRARLWIARRAMWVGYGYGFLAGIGFAVVVALIVAKHYGWLL